jgi:tRNA wybutosine-synthesizing protein 2
VGTTTVHREHGLSFAFDAARVMFSSGNVAERARLGSLDCRGETVVDLFAGIGYFSIPLAARARASRVYACEVNPDAFEFLQENTRLNRVEETVVPLMGDCRKVAPRAVADRVVCGYIGGTDRFLPTALAALKPAGGIVHFHEAYPQETKFADARLALGRAACGGFKVRVLGQREVKSFAPGIDHVVVDAEFRPLASHNAPSKRSSKGPPVAVA